MKRTALKTILKAIQSVLACFLIIDITVKMIFFNYELTGNHAFILAFALNGVYTNLRCKD